MRALLATIVAVLVCLFMGGCDDEPKQVTAAEFQAMLPRNPESMRCTQFIGVKDGKAYLKVSTMSLMNQKKWKVEYFVTDARELPGEWLQKQQTTTAN